MNKFFLLFFLVVCFIATTHGQNQNVNLRSPLLISPDCSYAPGNEIVDNNWIAIDYDDSVWKKWTEKILGYDNGFNGIGKTNTLYTRYKFAYPYLNKDSLEYLNLKINFDDGFVAYINGHEIARSNMGRKGSKVFAGQLADRSHDFSSNIDTETKTTLGYYIQKDSIIQFLKPQNVLCIELHNDSINGKDLLQKVDLDAALYNPLKPPLPGNSFPNYFYRAQVQLDSTLLPLILIESSGDKGIPDEPKIPALMKIISNAVGSYNHPEDTVFEYNGPIAIERHGASSQFWSPKDSYGLKTKDEKDNNRNVSLLGMPAEHDWILQSPFSDKSLIRNNLAYTLGAFQGHYAPRTRFCEVIVNGEYMGVEVLTEKVKRDSNRVDIASLEIPDNTGLAVTGGYIINIDKSNGSATGGWESPLKIGNWRRGFQYSYPEAKDMTPEQKKYIQSFILDFEKTLLDSNFRDTTSGYSKFIDINSFIDYWIVVELSQNGDALFNSTFFHKNKDYINGKSAKINMGPLWDYNLGFGNDYNWYNENSSRWVFESDYHIIWYYRLMQDTFFRNKAITRYQFLRNHQFSKSNISNTIDSLANSVQEASNRNFTAWPVLTTYIDPNAFLGGTFSAEIDFLKNWLMKRLTWMDENISQIAIPVVNYDSILNPVSIKNVLAFSNDIKIYPNPATDFVNISFTNSGNLKAELVISDITGKPLMYEEIFSKYDNLYSSTLNISALEPGKIYFCNLIINGKLVSAKKLIKL